MRARAIGIAALAATFAADQASKRWVLALFERDGPAPIDAGPFLRLLDTWNDGVSFSLLRQDTEWGRFALIGFMLAASLGLFVWLWRARSTTAAFGLGLIVGGALGNALDRIVYGAVFDFLRLDLKLFVWPTVFNVADLAIVVGVGALLYDGLAPGRPHAASETP